MKQPKPKPEACPYCGRYLRGWRAYENRAMREDAEREGRATYGQHVCAQCASEGVGLGLRQ